jgi:cystathionine beta-lyase
MSIASSPPCPQSSPSGRSPGSPRARPSTFPACRRPRSSPTPGLLEAFKLETERAGYELGQVFGVVGFEAAYAHGGEWLDALLPYLEANIDFLERFLTERIPGIRLVRPEGTYLALLDCRGLGLEPDELNRFFLTKAQVYFSDGTIFGRELEGFVRVNFGCPRALLKEALERIERAVKNLGG